MKRKRVSYLKLCMQYTQKNKYNGKLTIYQYKPGVKQKPEVKMTRSVVRIEVGACIRIRRFTVFSRSVSATPYLETSINVISL